MNSLKLFLLFMLGAQTVLAQSQPQKSAQNNDTTSFQSQYIDAKARQELLQNVDIKSVLQGGHEGNGGDPQEMNFRDIAINIQAWIQSGNADQLQMPKGLTIEAYKTKMNQALKNYHISFTTSVVYVDGAEKTCKNIHDGRGDGEITCNERRYRDASINERYRLVHHEFAGLAGLEVNQNQDSDYQISDQISGYLKNETVLRLPVVPAFAKMTLKSVSGASNVDFTRGTLPIVYGGFVGTCSNPDGTHTCDTCSINTTSFQPCSFASVYEDLNLVFTFKSAHSFKDAIVVMSDGTNTYTPARIPTAHNYAANSPITVTIPWSSICAFNSNSCTGGADGSITSLTMTFTVISETTGAKDSMTVNMVFRYVDATATSSTEFYTPCTSTNANDVTSDGACGFTIFPGNKAAYITELDYASTYPVVSGNGDGSTFYDGIVVWRSQPQGNQSTTNNVANDIASIASITTASPYTIINIDNTKPQPILKNSRIDGLKNNSRYCFAIGNRDLTGIISNMTPVTNPSFITSSNADNYCIGGVH